MSRHTMETQRPVQVYVYLTLIFLPIILLVGVGACVHSSSFSSEVGRCNVNFDYKSDPNVRSLPCSQKYLMKSYFEKHSSLLDSDFQVFLTQELPLGCYKALPQNMNSMLRMSILQRHLIGDGSHRRLFSSIKFKIQTEAVSELPRHFCQAIIIERLSSGVFADPFELQHLVERDVFMDAAVFGDTNLELPSSLSNQSVVEVHMDIGHNILARHGEGVEVNIELPLHARYPPLDGSGYSRVEMGLPDLLMHCSMEENLQHQNCLWILIPEGIEYKSDNVWEVPSGNMEHAKVVSAITFISALLSTLLIVFTSICSSGITSFKNWKSP